MVQFIDLWRGHPSNDSVDAPCIAAGASQTPQGETIAAGQPAYRNQSAIRMGVALRRAGVRVDHLSPRIVTCAHHDKAQMHYLYPRQLADGLRLAKLPGFGDMELIGSGDVERFHVRLLGRTGVLYVRDYWRRESDEPGRPTGDLIDLWNGYRTTESWLMEWMSWAGYRSPYPQAGQMWFWPVS